ncbi:MAG: redox-sensing transcriptional repressor Rex [Oscillospiraceae bacterium]|nr:redox-sensing transcriptional repressor Rex [Oscillospiraceae bacterium]
MSNQIKVSLPVIRRLPKYYRYLGELLQNGVIKISSSGLARIMGTTASQVRQDLNCFGGFGQQGIGYNTELLRNEIGKLLYRGQRLETILIGVGSLGQTISKWITAEDRGYHLAAAFDANPALFGSEVCGAPVLPIEKLAEYCRLHKPQVAVLCIPREPARKLAPTLVGLGIRGFWNFSHYDLSVNNPDIIVENVHLGDSLMSLAFRVHNEAVSHP